MACTESGWLKRSVMRTIAPEKKEHKHNDNKPKNVNASECTNMREQSRLTDNTASLLHEGHSHIPVSLLEWACAGGNHHNWSLALCCLGWDWEVVAGAIPNRNGFVVWSLQVPPIKSRIMFRRAFRDCNLRISHQTNRRGNV